MTYHTLSPLKSSWEYILCCVLCHYSELQIIILEQQITQTQAMNIGYKLDSTSARLFTSQADGNCVTFNLKVKEISSFIENLSV